MDTIVPVTSNPTGIRNHIRLCPRLCHIKAAITHRNRDIDMAKRFETLVASASLFVVIYSPRKFGAEVRD